MFDYKMTVLDPENTTLWSRAHDGSIVIDEVNGGYKVCNGNKMLESVKTIILGLVKMYNNTPLECREIMNGTRVLDYYKRKGE